MYYVGGGGGLSEKLIYLIRLETKMERNPYSYMSELFNIESEFNSSVELFHQHTVMKILNIMIVDSDLTTTTSGSDTTTVAENLADCAMFLARVSRFYTEPFSLNDFPLRLIRLLASYARYIPSTPRFKLAQALTLLDASVSIINIDDTLSLFMELQTLGDQKLTNLASNHVFDSLWRTCNNQHRRRKYQTLMFNMLQEKSEAVSMRVLVTLWKLYQGKVWFDEKTAIAICTASFHPALGIRTAALSLLLENKMPMIENDKDHDDSDCSHELAESEKEDHDDSDTNHNSPLNHLIDRQGFAERLFSHLIMPSEEGSEVKMMMLKLTARVIGLHQLTLLDFYPFVQTYVQPHQQDIKNLLLEVVQACHDKVPHDAVKPLFVQIVNQFVCDGSCPEVITIGVDAVKEICIRMPSLMNDDMLQNLDLYEKADTEAARSLITFFHQFCTEARPEASEEVDFATDVPGDELLHESGGSNDSVCSVTDHNEEDDEMIINDESLGTQSKSEYSIRKRKLSDFSGEFMAGDKVEEQL